MSRIRTTLDSVTKAVSSTDLISKFSRFKPASVTVASNHEGKAQKETLASSNTADAAMPEIGMKEEDGEEKDSDEQCHQVKEKNIGSLPSSSPGVAKQSMQLFNPAALSTNMDETYKSLAQHINCYFGTSAQGEEEGSAPMQPHGGQDDPVSKPVVPTVCQTNGERIPVLSSVTKDQSIKASTSALPPPLLENSSSPHGTSRVQATEVAAQSFSEPPPTSTKKGFTHYLSYPRPSVQAFVGSYIAPLVPKFRGDAKSVTSEKDKAAAVAVEDPTSEKAAEELENEEEKAKRKLLLQREKVCVSKPKFSPHVQTYFLDFFMQIIARVSIDNRTRALVKGLERVNDVKLLTGRVEELSRHLLEFPETGGVAVKVSIVVRRLYIHMSYTCK